MSEVKKSIKEDWTMIPFLTLTILGCIAAILDFVYLQNFNFQVFAVAGLFLLVVGEAIRFKARLELKRKAGFGSYTGTGRVKIVKDHRLVKDGFYKYIRNPIYLGEILRNLGFVFLKCLWLVDSFVGFIFLAISY
jgi:protein-S-isoprenylcysteine O-methyltransferase Ste14